MKEEDTAGSLYRTAREHYWHAFIDTYRAWILAKHAQMPAKVVDATWAAYVSARESWLQCL